MREAEVRWKTAIKLGVFYVRLEKSFCYAAMGARIVGEFIRWSSSLLHRPDENTFRPS